MAGLAIINKDADFSAINLGKVTRGAFVDYITIDQSYTDGDVVKITGDFNGKAYQAIRALTHRYMGKRTADGVETIIQLDDTNSAKFLDGSEAPTSQNDVFVKLPVFYYHSEETSPNVWKIGLSMSQIGPDWIKFDGDKRLIGAFFTSNQVVSRSGVSTRTSFPRNELAQKFAARGTGFGGMALTWANVLKMLCLFAYGKHHFQSAIGYATNYQNNYMTGDTLSLGMSDSAADANGAQNFMGVEGMTTPTYVTDTLNETASNNLYTNRDLDGSVKTFIYPTSTYLNDKEAPIKRLLIGHDVNFTPSEIDDMIIVDDGSFAKYWQQSTGVYQTGGAYATSQWCYRTGMLNTTEQFARSGAFQVTGNLYNSSKSYVGARLTFYGKINIINSVDDFNALNEI